MKNPYVVGKYCIIEEGVSIGRGTVIGDYVKILRNTVIGENCYIGDYSKIEGALIKNNVTLQGRNRIGFSCILCDDVEMKYNAILTSHATIGKGVFLGVQSVTLGSDSDKIQVSGTYICDNSYIGGQSIISPGLDISEKIILGANSFLMKYYGPGTYVGSPAQRIKQ